MDLVTILTSVLAISKVAAVCSSTLFYLITDVTSADQTIDALHKETASVQRSLDAIAKTLEAPSVRKYDKLVLWDDLGACLADCGSTVNALHVKLQSIKDYADTKQRGLFKSSVQVIKKRIKDDDIKALRDQMHSHSAAMQLMLQTISVHILCTVPDTVLENLNPVPNVDTTNFTMQFQKLLDLVVDLHKRSDSVEQTLRLQHESWVGLERAAKAVASNASAIMSSRSSSSSEIRSELRNASVVRKPVHSAQIQARSEQSVKEVTEAFSILSSRSPNPFDDPPSASNMAISMESAKSHTANSADGEPLPSEVRDRIAAWVAQDVRGAENESSMSRETQSVFSEALPGASQPSSTGEDIDVPQNESEHDFSDAEERDIGLEMIQRGLSEGRKRIQSDPFQAEQLLRRAVSQIESLRTKKGMPICHLSNSTLHTPVFGKTKLTKP